MNVGLRLALGTSVISISTSWIPSSTAFKEPIFLAVVVFPTSSPMSSAKSPSVTRFGSFFGIKRRPSSNLVIRPSSPSYEQQEDPFSTNASPLSANAEASSSTTSPLKSSPLGRVEPALVIDIPTFVRVPSNGRRPGSPTARRRLDSERDHHHLSVEVGSDNEDETDGADSSFPIIPNGTMSRSRGRPPLTLRPDGSASATSVESLALAAAIAHANGMVLKPDPASANSHRGKSPAIDEYPSPPPSNHGSPRNSRTFLEDEEESLFHTVGSFGSTGVSSLPTTPALIDSFPTIPHSSTHIGSRDLQPPPLAVLANEALPIRTSSRPASSRQRGGSTSDAWARPIAPVMQHHNSDLEQVWDLTEQDETDYNYPLQPRGGLPLPGPPPSAPLPPEPASPRFQTSAIHKHFHQLELDFTSLTRKLTSASSASGGSTHPSTPDSSRVLKKSASHSLLRREHSGMSASSAASSSQGIMSPASTSTAAIPPSTSPQKSDGMASPYSMRHHSSQLSQSFSPVVSNRQRSTTESSVVAPLKLKEKPQKLGKERDSLKSRDERDKDKDGHHKRRFFAKYASAGSQVERDAAAILASIEDQDDVACPFNGNNGRGFADEELNANLSISSIKTRDGTLSATPLSPSSQRSPVDDSSSIFSAAWTANRTGVSPPEYVVQHILPPAELLRLEKMGFTAEGLSSRARDGKLGSPLSATGNSLSGIAPSTSSLVTNTERSRRSTSAPRVNEVLPTMPPEPKTRSQRSGSVAAAVSPISPSSARPSSSRQVLHGNMGAAKSAGALPLGSESKNGNRPSSSGKDAILQPLIRPGMIRPATTPSSPAGGFAPLALPPPPRPRVRSSHGEGHSNGDSSRSSRRSSNTSGTRAMPSGSELQKHHSIMRKPSFMDMMDDDGRPSLEEASPAAAPGISLDDNGSYFSHAGSRTPSTRSRSTTINGWQPEIPSIDSGASSSRGASYANNRTDDSFLDMGKLSLDTIRSADEDDNIQQLPAGSQYRYTPPTDIGPRHSPSYF